MFMRPTQEQTNVVEEVAAGTSLLVQAVAGSGKTKTLELASRHCPPGTVALAFNVAAKKELASRLPSHVDCLTLNGFGHRAWANTINTRPLPDTKKMKAICDKYTPATKLSYPLKLMCASAKRLGMIPPNPPIKGKALVEWSPSLLLRDSGADLEGVDIEILADPLADCMRESIRQAYLGDIDWPSGCVLNLDGLSPIT
jgi:hypothetical protein